MATGFAMLGNEIGYALAAALAMDPEFVTPVFVAPFVEESLKGILLLGLWWLRPRTIDGVVDGIVYAGVTAAGFAFVENILYFGMAGAEAGAGGVTATFVLRGLFSPFAHPLFTVCIGIGVGRAVRSGAAGSWALPFLGWVGAVSLHAIWNFSTTLGAVGLAVYFLFEVPVFVGFLWLIWWVRGRELRQVSHHLAPYVRSGRISPAEARMLGDRAERRRAKEWARHARGASGERAMRDFQSSATRLAHLRARLDHRHRAKGAVGTRATPHWETYDVLRQEEFLGHLDQLRQGFGPVAPTVRTIPPGAPGP
ncbi:PrsW family intramembrane metalloprotease [Kytococcus aerolatus]|uniref:PrsW family intramembrane metalloprotease n=1 Tax=Kytococcus aerolatus TaxID=592308 RepID=UPI000B58EBF5|nr:PrsW family intramembrane metalloprotease [Kytococcus aerolatus]